MKAGATSISFFYPA
jgi:H+-translocating NAD(P) transhydrogenase